MPQDKTPEITPQKHIEKINLQIETVLNKLTAIESAFMSRPERSAKDRSRSPELKDLFAALAKAQSIMPAVYGKKENPYLSIPTPFKLVI